MQQNVDSFINYGEIITHDKDQKIGTYSFALSTNVVIKMLTNYGIISGGISANSGDSTQVYMQINNYGIMSGVSTATYHTFTINNMGIINIVDKKFHFKNGNLVLKKYAITISENASVFNAFNGTTQADNSHLILDSIKSVNFADKNAKVILDFGSGFEFGAGYDLNKLIVNTDGTNALNVDFDRLMPKSDIYTLIQSGEYFIAKLAPEHSTIGNLYKANVRTMNNFWTISNSMIYPRKVYHSQNLGQTHSLLQYPPSLSTSGVRGWVEYPSLRDSANQNISSLRDLPTANRGNPHYENIVNSTLDSAIPLKSYESFAHRNESVNRRIQRQNKRNYNRKLQNQMQNLKENQRDSQNLSQTPHDYYFILTPFVNHNLFFESGRYNLSGLEYGFLTAFSGKLTPSNALGAHFMMSYGNIGDLKDKDFNITNLNLNVGINYKLDLIYDMYLKARGDFYYFSNTLDSLTIKNIKPNNLGFGASVSYGKDFDFGKGGVLGIEAGLDYKALKSNTISLQNNATKTISETYQKSLYNLIYVDLGLNYNKYFGNFGLNAGLGIKGNITANKLATSKIHISTFNKSVDMMLDNDNFLGYANLGASYVLNHKDFDMEFSLSYYGNYGDRIISNGGVVEWRVGW